MIYSKAVGLDSCQSEEFSEPNVRGPAVTSCPPLLRRMAPSHSLPLRSPSTTWNVLGAWTFLAGFREQSARAATDISPAHFFCSYLYAFPLACLSVNVAALFSASINPSLSAHTRIFSNGYSHSTYYSQVT